MKLHKDAFLKKYNPNRTLDKALASGIAAAVQHNSLYRKELLPERKETVVCVWRAYLKELIKRYKHPQSVE
ncbi:hypothetical protein, partial [Termitidicoccus mucosus]